MKAQRDEGCGRILLGDNTGGGAVMLRGSGSIVLEFGLQAGCFVYTCMYATVGRMYTEFQLWQNSACARSFGT